MSRTSVAWVSKSTESVIKRAAALLAESFQDNPLLRYYIGVAYQDDKEPWIAFFFNRTKVTIEDNGVLLLGDDAVAILLPPGSAANVSAQLDELDAQSAALTEFAKTTADWRESVHGILHRQEATMIKQDAWRVWFVTIAKPLQRSGKGKGFVDRVLQETSHNAVLLCHNGITKIFKPYGFRVLLDEPSFALPQKTGEWPADIGISSMILKRG